MWKAKEHNGSHGGLDTGPPMPSLTRAARPARPPDDDRRTDLERRVLGALEQLLAEGIPFTEIAVQRIATAAGIARSTFYRYFPDKSQLLIRMAELATTDLFGAAELWWRADHTDEQAGVVVAMRAMITGFREHRYLLLALSEVSAYDRDVGAYWRARVAMFLGLVRERLEADKRTGQVSAELDAAATALVLASMVERTIAVNFSAAAPVADEVLAEALGRAIWLTVYGDAPA
ncbi:TetR/AcrR family transcriptional regulator [Nocardia sp. XZ_19_385]|uniref:TetR/AcrR family transcriptional regulator n=1 Tax=Nocardia sp. XZ_19_385 TaxID=2769488 RepID=UPI0028168D12|nr:TetR/AcrR family transcriptional regulator [Nocardia sp. XZ_19_385]